MTPQSIKINTATVRVLVNDDPNRVIEFNPEDISFIDAFYGLIQEFDAKINEFKQRELIIRKNKTVDKFGIPVSTGEEIKLTKDLCAYLRNKIDELFGIGTSDTAFGKINTPICLYSSLTVLHRLFRLPVKKRSANIQLYNPMNRVYWNESACDTLTDIH